ncbi:MAG: hypothetical protein ACK5LR_01160 [Mangrovibacterium sp.]
MNRQFKKHVLLVFFSLVIIGSASAVQPVKRFAKSYASYVKDMRENSLYLSLAGNQVSFLNPTFFNRVENGGMSRGGVSFGLGLRSYPFIFDLSMQATTFNWDETLSSGGEGMWMTTTTNNKATLSGADCFVSYCFSVGCGRFWRVVVPNIGAGYSFYTLKGEETNGGGVLRVDSPMWKVGLEIANIKLKSSQLETPLKMSIFGAYYQSFALEKPTAIVKISFGLRFFLL